MPTKVSLNQILGACFQSLWVNRTENAIALSYPDFRRVMYRADIYTSEPSVRTAWTRLAVSPFCIGEHRASHIADEKIVINLSLVRAEFFEDYLEEKKQKKEKKQTGAKA